MLEERGWKTIKIVPFRRSGKWITGAEIQENAEGKKRVKLFKGFIKESGKNVVEYKGETLRFSMIQRFNIPSLDYWLKIHEHIVKLLQELEGQKSLLEWEKKKK